jgi:hypothetical protein
MHFLELALAEARAAQERIQGILKEAVQAQAYPEVAKIASLAELLATALGPEREIIAASDTGPQEHVTTDDESARSPRNSGITRRGKPSIPRRTPGKVTRAAAPGPSRGPQPLPDGYPRFEREADRLIKVGWSSRDRRGYEHRASKSVVFRFAERLSSQSASPFSMDQVLPITDERGAELPSYQAYLAVAWLRSVGAVRKVGKEGYSVDPALVAPQALERFWLTLTPR